MAERSPVPGAYIPPENRNPFLKFVENDTNVARMGLVGMLVAIISMVASTSPDYAARFDGGFILGLVSFAAAIGFSGFSKEEKNKTLHK